MNMTPDTTNYTWDHLPNRDEALDTVYAFVKALHVGEPTLAAGFIQVKDMSYFIKALHDGMLSYLDMVIEDEEWDDFEGKNLAFEVDDPQDVNEDDSLPEFTGKEFILTEGETVSVFLSMRGRVTPIRVHFTVVPAGSGYALRLARITAK